MNSLKSLWLDILIFLIAISLSGCISYGKLVPVSANGDIASIKELTDNWQGYRAYYAVWPNDQPVAILFDPKGDGKSLAADSWIKIRPEKNPLERIINLIHSRYDPRLYKILGPDNQAYGYVYSGLAQMTVEVLDEKTLRVHDVAIPPPTDI